MMIVDAVKDFRQNAGLSQSEFAEKFGLQTDTYRQWERGRRRPNKASELLLTVILYEPELVATVALSLRPRIMEDA